MTDYSKKIKEYREEKLLTQKQLADLLNVSNESVSRWEQGKFEPTMEIKRKLRQLFIDAGLDFKEPIK